MNMKNYELELPQNCSSINEEEMMYVDGGYYDSGYSIGYMPKYATTSGAFGTAGEIKNAFNWNNISQADLAAEIWFHAFAYYRGSELNAICASLGYNGIKNTGFWKSLKNGIQIKNGLDDAVEFGIKRYQIFRVTYTAAVGMKL